jgi:hypothetical protein
LTAPDPILHSSRILLFAFTDLGPMQTLFGTATLDARVWFVSGLMASTVLILVEIEKAVPRVMGRQSFRAVD